MLSPRAARFALVCGAVLEGFASAAAGGAEVVFIEAETFVPSSDGWQVQRNEQTARASRATSLYGAVGDPHGTASTTISLKERGRYRVWVRYLQVAAWRGAFRLDVLAAGQRLGGEAFDLTADANTQDWHYRWCSFEAELPTGDVVLRLSKHHDQNCVGYVRHVDCVLLTTDHNLVPDHIPFGPQTYVRVTLGEAYRQPAYVHIFADHFRDPWYGHYALAQDGCRERLEPDAKQLLRNGERTPWCNITPMVYQDSGAILNISVRYHYGEKAERLLAALEFATAPDDAAVVRTIAADCTPNGLVVVMPSDLTTPENLSRFGRDLEFAERTGRLADAHRWPTIGRRPERFPFFVSHSLGGFELPLDKQVTQRERQTLDYFGFSNQQTPYIGGGIWLMKNGSYAQPETAAMRLRAQEQAAAFQKSGKRADQITFCMLMDEPGGPAAASLAADAAAREQFREWLKRLGKSPSDLGVGDWDAVVPVTAEQRDRSPALHYYTQRFRTRSLGDFLSLQRRILEEAYGASFPAVANFSDGAVYTANFFGQGVDYFELLDGDDQNAIWSEDWANLSSTYQCSAFNVDLMRAAARPHGQKLGHYLVAHAGRKPWDIKLKAVGEVARGVKILENFFYGTSWGTHEGGPPWQSHAWYARPETWSANAEIVREIGGVEELLIPAMPTQAEVAIVYSSASDIWTLDRNHAYGFDRMHTWLALAHAQVPVDIVGERQVEAGSLADYKVCFLSGPGLTLAATQQLRPWVERGGTLWLTAGAASRDEYNRPLSGLDEILPADRQAVHDANPFLYAGSLLRHLPVLEQVQFDGGTAPVLSVKQGLVPRPGAQVLGRFQDGSAALVASPCGQGRVYCTGFLPGLSYVHPALMARHKVLGDPAAEPGDKEILARSDNPWQFPAAIRELILQPVRSAGVRSPVRCDIPLVDAVLMEGEGGALLPLANYTLRPLHEVRLQVRTSRPVRRIESVHRGCLSFQPAEPNTVTFSLPLDATDFVKLE